MSLNSEALNKAEASRDGSHRDTHTAIHTYEVQASALSLSAHWGTRLPTACSIPVPIDGEQ